MKKLIDFVTSRFTAKQNLTIANTIIGIAIVINLVDMFQGGMEIRLVPLIITVVLAVIGALYLWLFVRCPHCGDKLKGCKNKSSLPERCPNCNKRLDLLPTKSRD